MTLTIASQNVAAMAKPWQRQTFGDRLVAIGAGVGYYHPGIMAVQEAGSGSYLSRLDSELRRHGLQRAPRGGRWRYLYFDPKQVRHHDSGLFWLNAVGKYAAWGKFTDLASGVTLFVTSAHLVQGDEAAAQARYKQAETLLRKSREVNRFHHPEIHAGDFNSYHRVGDVVFEPHQYVDALDVALSARHAGYDTFNGRTTVKAVHATQELNARHYDHFYVSKQLADNVFHWSQHPSIQASDHNLIAIKVKP